jgi:hypothetical protein
MFSLILPELCRSYGAKNPLLLISTNGNAIPSGHFAPMGLSKTRA